MSARFDTEVMQHLEKLYRQHVLNESAGAPGVGAARMSTGENVAFAFSGQNPRAMFHENIAALQSGTEAQESASPLQDLLDDEREDFTNEKILQPRRLSLRVF